MKKEYRVTLMTTAYVKQTQTVEAENEQEAIALAKSRMDDNVWEYDGLEDDGVVQGEAR